MLLSPFGNCSNLKASNVDSLYYAKQYEAAQAAADEAKKWSIYGIIAGVVINAFVLLLQGAAFFAMFLPFIAA